MAHGVERFRPVRHGVDPLPQDRRPLRGARAGAPEPPTTEQIRRILRECHGNRTQAARTLGIARSSFYRLLEERGLMGVHPAAFASGRSERHQNGGVPTLIKEET